MNLIQSYKHIFRRSPLARVLTWGVLFVTVTLLFALIGRTVRKRPVIYSIDPSIGIPGDEMKIIGNSFGSLRENSYVEIAGSRITASGYTLWTDNEIRVILPSNVQDGLVVVRTAAGLSAPAFFANETGIPVAVRADPASSIPIITAVQPENASVGQIVTVSGTNFGVSRGKSKVWFTANRDDAVSSNDQSSAASLSSQADAYIEANPRDFDYEFWSDTEIRVRIPDGAASGSFFIETARGMSPARKITVNFPYGKKKFSGRRTYVVQISADIANHVALQDSVISLYMPKPVVSAQQPFVQMNDCYPDPFILDDPYDIIHRKQLKNIVNNNERFSQTFVVGAYTVNGNISGNKIPPYKEKSLPRYKENITADPCVPSSDSSVKTLVESLCEKEKSPYGKAKVLYNFMLDEYKLVTKAKNSDSSVIEVIRKKKGDPYEFAMLYTALCRAAGIPSVSMSGILVQSKDSAVPHWWTELYFEGYGWFPVDVSLGAGLKFQSFSAVENPREYYFGNMDCQHVAFSRGWHQIRQSNSSTKVVYRPRTYALQSVWEEAGDATSSYSSLWNDPVVLGIY